MLQQRNGKSIQYHIPSREREEKNHFTLIRKSVCAWKKETKEREKKSESWSYTEIQFVRFQPFHLSIHFPNVHRGKIIVYVEWHQEKKALKWKGKKSIPFIKIKVIAFTLAIFIQSHSFWKWIRCQIKRIFLFGKKKTVFFPSIITELCLIVNIVCVGS